jgi:hypothetical protein
VKKRLLVIAASIPSLALAGDGFLGTKVSPSTGFDSGASTPVGVGAVAQLAIALGVVLLLVRYVLPKALTKVNKKLVTNISGGIQIEESASFAGGNLYVVRARGKTLLLSAASTGVTCLADLTETEKAAPDLPTFGEMLETAPSYAPVYTTEYEDPADPVQAALARLDRLDRMTQS